MRHFLRRILCWFRAWIHACRYGADASHWTTDNLICGTHGGSCIWHQLLTQDHRSVVRQCFKSSPRPPTESLHASSNHLIPFSVVPCINHPPCDDRFLIIPYSQLLVETLRGHYSGISSTGFLPSSSCCQFPLLCWMCDSSFIQTGPFTEAMTCR